MKTNSTRIVTKALTATVCLVLALGCALHKAQVAFDKGDYDEALAEYRQVLRKDPNNVKAKIGFRRTAPLAAEAHLVKARQAERSGLDDVVRKEVATAVVLDPSNAVAVDKMARLEEAARRKQAAEDAEDSVDAMRARGEAKALLPINPRSLEGMDLNFSRKTSLREIFQQLSKNSGVNIILHTSASQQDITISVDLRGLTFQRILDTLMLQSDLFYRVMDTNTIMVFKKTVQNLTDYENKLIRTFYLSNADGDQIRSIFNAIMPQLRVFVDKRLNALTVQAKLSDLTIAQRIVNQLDKAKAEVMVYIELMEVSQSASESLGLLPVLGAADKSGIYRLGASLDGNLSNPNTNKGAIRINKSDVKFYFPSLALDMLKSNGDSKILASPNVRVVSGEEGTVNIGDKISTTQSALNIPGVNSGTTGGTSIGGIATAQTQYSYEDVGVKIKVKPRVHFNGDITIELDADIKTKKDSVDPGRPNIGQRMIKTQARLRDGETAVFGGLLKEEEQKTLQGIWGITDIPILGKLLGNTSRTTAKTDVILTIRAVVVRKPDFADEDFEAFDPEQAAGEKKPFTPKPDKREAASDAAQASPAAPPLKPTGPAATLPGPQPAAVKAAPAPAATAPATTAPAAPQGLPTAATTPQVMAAPDAAQPAPMGTPAPVPATPKTEEKPAAPAEPSELVFFMNPMSGTATKGQKVQVTIYASGASGLTEGAMELRIDPKLKLTGMSPGDFLSADGGNMVQVPGKDGQLTLKFTRKGANSDSGALAVLDLECSEVGKATVMIQNGTYKVGANPISGRVVNAMITVE